MPRKNVEDVAGASRYVVSPVAKTVMCVDGGDPFGKESTFSLILLGLLAFGFENQRVAGSQADQESATYLRTAPR